MQDTALDGGFADPSIDAAHAFRAAMEAMARPGTIHRVAGAAPPEPVSVAAAVLLLTLVDPETPLALTGAADRPAVRDWVRFHCGAPIGAPGEAAFVLGRWSDLVPLQTYRFGTPDYPDRSATLIVEVDRLEPRGTRLRGPGIREEAALSLPDPVALAANAARFPLGLDFFFCCGDRLAALPRSTAVLGGDG